MNWTSSFLAIVLHLLLAPVGTVVKPAEHEVVRPRERCRDAKDKVLTRQSSCSVN